MHCWGGSSSYCWYPQTKNDLQSHNFQVLIPNMPATSAPKLSLWLPKLEETIGEPDEDLYLIGHSVGCVTIMRYLESLPDNKKVGGVVFVAGFTDDLGYPELTNFFESRLDFQKIRSRSRHFLSIASDNDPYVPLNFVDILKEKLGSETIIKRQMGHFSGPIDSTGSCLSLPEVALAIIKQHASC